MFPHTHFHNLHSTSSFYINLELNGYFKLKNTSRKQNRSKRQMGAGKITKSEHKMENWAHIEGERPEQEEERQRSQDRQRWREHQTCHRCASEASFPPKLCLYYSPLTTFPTHQQPQIWLGPNQCLVIFRFPLLFYSMEFEKN